ncbi:IclR family transcriptional regulator [Sphaerimonospora sp. CA-214678]|uniref:IclR family transcriptional regulator n=1 Tax=Sphaerimonospora sp. CA-214678 TaxID=3240029 RepID=UPI003D93FC57
MRPSALKMPPSYAITSVDHALKLVAVLQLEGGLTVAAAADRLGVARSTAHRVLQMLVYRDFAVQDEDRTYRPGLVLELPAHSPARAAELRSMSLPYLQRLGAIFDESVNISIRAGKTTRFIASIECRRALRVTSREGMVFPLHRTTTGMLHLASLPDRELQDYLDRHLDGHRAQRRSLLQDLNRVRRTGFALNLERSERGLVAIGVPVPCVGSGLFAGLSVSMPSVRYDEQRLDGYVSVLRSASHDLARDLTARGTDVPMSERAVYQ